MRISSAIFSSGGSSRPHGWTGRVFGRSERRGDSSESPSAEQSAPLDVQTYTSDKYGFSFQYARRSSRRTTPRSKLRAVPAARTRWQCSTPMGRRSAGSIATPSW